MGHLFFLPGRLRVTAPHRQHRNAACQTQGGQRQHRQRIASCPFANNAIGIHHHRAANQVGDRADGRQPGDYGIVKTDYGYHILFFVGAGDEIYWFQTAKEDYLSDLAVKIQDEITAKYTFVSYVDQAALVDVLTAANDSEAAQ